MRIALVNLVWDRRALAPQATLERFPTLTGWARALVAQDPDVAVTVYQRFHADLEIARVRTTYRFVADPGAPRPGTWFRGTRRFIEAVTSLSPDLVHVNGLDHPLFVRRLRRALPTTCALVVQDHGGFDPLTLSGARKLWMRSGLSAAAALLVATPRQAEAFRASGLVPPVVAVHDVMEASTSLRADERRDRHQPLAILWVGRLNANKDPLTVLEGFARFVERSGVDATLTFVYGSNELEPQLRAQLASGPHAATLRSRVTLVGEVSPEALANVYDAADLFVLGSHREGSGYALIEAMACGVVPVVTDIPSFRSITGEGTSGVLWRAGDAASLADALARAAAMPTVAAREACRAWFESRFSWPAIGRRALEIYGALART